jgi:sugar phosphate isomerase/epimerase
MTTPSRRQFLAQVAGTYAGSVLLSAQNGGKRWADRLGLQVYTVRDHLSKDFEGTFAKIAEAGYKDVELFGSLGDRSPKDVRAILDRNGLSAVSTHIGVGPGADLDRQLEGYQIIGHRFTAVRTGSPPSTGGARGGRRPPEPNTPDRWKQQAAALNQVGQAGKRYGIRALLHNHVGEFVSMEGGGTGYEILLKETDPNLVVMELDIGWSSIAGQNAIEMFKKNPGRYALWHVKDTKGLAATVAKPIGERQQGASSQFVPVGTGDLDYKTIFAAAQTAGLQHFFIEQDNAVDGDSVAAIQASAANLKRLLG